MFVFPFFFKLPHYSPVIAQNTIVSSRVLGIRRDPLFAVLLSELSGPFGRMCVCVYLEVFVPRYLTATLVCFQSLVLVGGEQLSLGHANSNSLVAKASVGRI